MAERTGHPVLRAPDLSHAEGRAWLRGAFEHIRSRVADPASKPAYDTLHQVLSGCFKPCGQRSANEVYWEHILLRYCGNVSLDIERNYSTALQLSLTGSVSGIFHGHAGIAASARMLNERLATTRYLMLDTVVRDNGQSGGWVTERWAYQDRDYRFNQVCDGLDSFLIRDGRIEVQMIHYTVEAAQPAQDFYRRLRLPDSPVDAGGAA